MTPLQPPRWTTDEFDRQRAIARQQFCNQRLGESLGIYAQTFNECHTQVSELLDRTHQLLDLEAALGGVVDADLVEVLSNPNMMDTLRYIAGPPVSADDLAELSDTSLSPKRLRADPAAASKIISLVSRVVDPKRFWWVREGRPPNDAERAVAVTATAVLMASQRVETARRMQSKVQQMPSKHDVLV